MRPEHIYHGLCPGARIVRWRGVKKYFEKPVVYSMIVGIVEKAEAKFPYISRR
jgi:hypothetical protein